MQLSLEQNDNPSYIQAYNTGEVKINNIVYRNSLIITPNQLLPSWRPQNLAELSPADLRLFTELKVEVVLLGTGSTLRFPSPGVTAELLVANIGVEIMDTGAACRTFNVLLSEGRKVAAGLLLQ